MYEIVTYTGVDIVCIDVLRVERQVEAAFGRIEQLKFGKFEFVFDIIRRSGKAKTDTGAAGDHGQR